MKETTLITLLAIGVVAGATWWMLRESLQEVSRISKEPATAGLEGPDQEDLARLKEHFETR